MDQVNPIMDQNDALKEKMARWEVFHRRIAEDPERALTEHFGRIAASGLPVIAGPWLSEVGFELLYWIPCLNWVAERFGIAKDRIVAISRGGVEDWYESAAGGYWDIFSRFSAEHFKTKNTARRAVRGTQKQRSVSDFDVEVLAAFLKDRDIDRFEWIHPLCMYLLFESYWKSQQGSVWLADHTRFKPIPRPAAGPLPGLPGDYVAAKFYFSKAFPKTAENTRFIVRTLDALTATGHVVLLNTGLSLDDHAELAPGVRRRLWRVDGRMTAEDNLRVQSRVIGGAKAFYGTYGGFSYLAPFMGVPSVSFYSEENTLQQPHLDAAHGACRILKYGSLEGIKLPKEHAPRGADFLAMHVRQMDSLRRHLGVFETPSPGSPLWRRAARSLKSLVSPEGAP